ncbi:hypothetical protein DYB32_005363, partial [Aphanomyces invadans]
MNRWLDAYADRFPDVTIDNTSDSTGVLGLAGPRAAAVLAAIAAPTNGTIPFMKLHTTQIQGVDVRVLGLSFTGEAGYVVEFYHHHQCAARGIARSRRPSHVDMSRYEVHCPLEHIQTVYDAVWRAGQAHGIENVGTFAVNAMRLEKGFRVWGADMNKDTTPLQAGLHRFVQLDKATPFVGQKALQQVLQSPCRSTPLFMFGAVGGAPWKLENPRPPPHPLDAWGNEAVWHNGKVVGNTTSGGFGHIVNKSIAFAYVPTSLAVDGNHVQVEL